MTLRLSPAMLVAVLLLLVQSFDATSADAIVVRAGHLLDIDSGSMLTDQALRIEGGRIKP